MYFICMRFIWWKAVDASSGSVGADVSSRCLPGRKCIERRVRERECVCVCV